MTTYKCPECENEIDHLLYNERGSYNAWGSCDLSGEGLDQSDSDMNSYEITYECPECNFPLDPDDVVEEEEGEKDTEEEKLEEPVESTKVVLKGTSLIQTNKGRAIFGVRCANCHTTTLIDENETGILCHKCGEEINCNTKTRV